MTKRRKQFTEMLLMGYEFVLKEYGIDGIPNILISKSLEEDKIARITPEKDQNGNDTLIIEVSNRLLKYYSKKEQEDIIKHELVHYSLAYLGRRFKDGDKEFEDELIRLGLPNHNKIDLRGKVHIYSCNYQHDEIELLRLTKRTKVEDRICPCCKHPMKWKGTYLITKEGREKVAE